MTRPSYVPAYYRVPTSDKEYLCSTAKDNGLHRCQDLPPLRSTDLTTQCQNSLPSNWRPPEPTIIITHFGNETRRRIEDRFIDGELVPFDLVPGDESSPFLVKQLSPLIAQSVFQPAYAPQHLSSLSPMRQKRDTTSSRSNNNTSKAATSSAKSFPSSPIQIGSEAHTMYDGRNLTAGKNDSQSSNMAHPYNHHHQTAKHIVVDRHKNAHHHGFGERIRVARLANLPRKNKLAHKSSSYSESQIDDGRDNPMIETNANSDDFESIGQSEENKSDKLSRKYFIRKKANKGACINWNKYYTDCRAGDINPFQGTISFDNVGMAWTTIFLVISLEGWSDIMYLLQDSHSFWVWIYFVLLIVIGSFFMINLCLVVIATQFSATKKREMERMRQERMKFSSSSTLTATSESTNCYTVIVKSIAKCLRRAKISFINALKRRKCARLHQQRLRERQQQINSRQITVNTQVYSSRQDKVKGEQQISSFPQHKAESIAHSGEFDAAKRRSSWKRSSKSAIQHQHATEPTAISAGCHSIPKSVSTSDDQQQNLLADCTKRGEVHGTVSGNCRQLKHAAPSTRRSIRLGDTGCNASCRRANQNSSHKRLRGAMASQAMHQTCRHYHDCEMENIEISFCPKFIMQNSKLQKFRRDFNRNIKLLVDHRYFQRLILLAILINAISMGIEYHNQPEQLTEAVEISNIVFAFLFLIEMILKLIAHGVYDYVIDGFNCFDGCIVILSILELFESSSGSGLSVLRTFRLLRILKLVRFMPALRRQLVIMLRTLDNVAVFFALLVLFIFIFSILGMNLFGCKFCETLPDGTERCDRKNFNSLLWSLVTVFQILTQEDWNVVLFNGMEKTSHWAALYFVLLMTFGNYVLFNLLVAILVEGFSQEDDFKVSSSSSYTINNSSNNNKAYAIKGSQHSSRSGRPLTLEQTAAQAFKASSRPVTIASYQGKCLPPSRSDHCNVSIPQRAADQNRSQRVSHAMNMTKSITSAAQLNEQQELQQSRDLAYSSSDEIISEIALETKKSPAINNDGSNVDCRSIVGVYHSRSENVESNNARSRDADLSQKVGLDAEVAQENLPVKNAGTERLALNQALPNVTAKSSAISVEILEVCNLANASSQSIQQTASSLDYSGRQTATNEGRTSRGLRSLDEARREFTSPHDNDDIKLVSQTGSVEYDTSACITRSDAGLRERKKAENYQAHHRHQVKSNDSSSAISPIEPSYCDGLALKQASNDLSDWGGAIPVFVGQQQYPKYWNYRQLVNHAALDQSCDAFNSAAVESNAQSLAFFGIRRPPKRLVYFYDINDDVDEELDFLTKSLETKSYATSLMGQHDHYLDNIAKSQAAAAKLKADNKLQGQYRINISRADQEHRAALLAQTSDDRSRQINQSQQQTKRAPGSFDSRAAVLGSNVDSASNRVAVGHQQQHAISSQTSSSRATKDRGLASSSSRVRNVELLLSPHWSSLPSHLNNTSLAMMRFYQSSYTNNFYLGKRERALVCEQGQFDKSCCRVDYSAYVKAVDVFVAQSSRPPNNNSSNIDTKQTLNNQHQPLSNTSSGDARQSDSGTDIDLGVIYEPFRMLPNMGGNVVEQNDQKQGKARHSVSDKANRPMPNYWQREFLVSLENYANAVARYEEKQAKRRDANSGQAVGSSATSNINRTTQALRRGSVCVLAKLRLLHSQHIADNQASTTSINKQPADTNQHQSTSPYTCYTRPTTVPRLSLTKADSLVNDRSNSLRTQQESSLTRSERTLGPSREISDVAIHMCSEESLNNNSPLPSENVSIAGAITNISGQLLHTMSRLHHPTVHQGNVTGAYGRHSIANLPLRSLAETQDEYSELNAEDVETSESRDPLARPASYTPNVPKRSLPRQSLTSWFGTRSQTSENLSRNSCISETSKTLSELTERCSRLMRPNLKRRRSFSGPYEWLLREHRPPPFDMMLANVSKKQTSKKRLKKIKPQKSNSSDFHSLNNRRVYKLDSRGFQTKLRGVFYVITHDPLVLNAQPTLLNGQPERCRTVDTINISAYDLNGQQREKDNVLSSNEMESSFFNTSNEDNSDNRSQSRDTTGRSTGDSRKQQRRTFLIYFHWTQWMIQRRHYSLFIFSPQSMIRRFCLAVTSRKEFDYFVLFFISMNCVTLAMERPKIPPWSKEREFLTIANYYFTFMFTLEMALKVVAKGLYYGKDAYLSDSWNIMDGSLVGFSLFDLLLSIVADRSPRIFAILRVFRLLRSLRPLRVINRLMGLKLVVQTLLLSLRPIGNIVLICCTFFIIFGILGVQLFKGTFYYCDGPDPLEIMRSVRTREDCMLDHRNRWINRKYNFDNLGQALMALFVLSSKDGWVNIMYTGLDAVGVDMQPRENYNEWRLIYFISFLLLVAFFVLNMFVGVVVENFHRCRKEQELEEKARRAEKRQRKLDKRRRKLREPPYYSNYGKVRLLLHKWVTGGYFDLLIAAVIGFNVIFMSLEHYQMPYELIHLLKVSNYVFTAAFILEAVIKSTALGMRRYLKDRWNQLDVLIVVMSIIGIIFEEMDSFTLPINPTLLRVLRVMRIARVLKLLKMAKGIRALLDTVMQALPQVGNLGLLFFLLFFIFAALGVELFGRLECNDEYPCSGLMDQHAHFQNFGLAFLTLFRVATGDNWNGIMKDTLRDKCDPSSNCLKNCCVSQIIAPLYFVVFVLLAQFVLVNVVVAVLMKHLEESHHEMEIDEEYELDKQLAEELEAKKRALLEARARQNIYWI